MTLVLSSSRATYTCVKRTFSLKEYQAHDLLLLEYLPLTKALPIPVAFHNDAQILLISTMHYSTEFLGAVLGMAYMIPAHQVLCLEPIKSTCNTVVVPHSLHASTHASENKITRPIYFDMVSHGEDVATEIGAYTHETLHRIVSMSMKLWDSHALHVALLPEHLLSTTRTHSALSSMLIHVCAAIEKLPQSIVLPQDYIQWLLHAKKKWRLSSTKFKQLTMLTEGHYQATEEMLPSSLLQLLEARCAHTQDTGRAFEEAKKILMKSLY